MVALYCRVYVRPAAQAAAAGRKNTASFPSLEKNGPAILTAYRSVVCCGRLSYTAKHIFLSIRAHPGASAHDGLIAFEKDLNRRLKTNKKSYIQVVFIPVSHDELIPALLDGRGDIAVANLTITPERQALVDFSDPSSTDVRELVVTAPGVAGINTIDDLADQRVFVRPSSSYHEHIIELNRRFKEKGLKPVRYRFHAPAA